MIDLEWDKKFALVQTDGDEDLLNDLMDLFNTSADTDYLVLKKGFLEKDYASLAASAHSIKGSSLSLGIHRISTLALEIETKARQGDMSDLEEMVELLGGLLVSVKGL